MKDYLSIAIKYAKHVECEKIPACKQIKLACVRFLNDLEKDNQYYFCEESAKKACFFVENMRHTKGKWAREKKLLSLEPWQVFFVLNIFGWKEKSTNLRRYREAFLLVPRKNGKSQLAAAIGNYMLCADGEHAAEVFSGATTEKQAGEVFLPAQIMCRDNENLKSFYGIDVRASNINIPQTGSKFERIIGDPPDGSSPSCAIIDEIHEHKDSRMIDTMITGMGAREHPLMLYISTAGSNISSPCYSLQDDLTKVLNGVIDNDRLFGMIYTIDEDDKWDSIESLKKANPNFGVSVNEQFLLDRLQDARNDPKKQSTYKTKHLDMWVGASNAFFNIEKWRALECGFSIKDFYKKRAYIGLDLASKIDIAAIEILIETNTGEFVRFGKYYLPEATVDAEVNKNYRGWWEAGLLNVTDGNMIDFDVILDDIVNLCSLFEVASVAYDPHQATMLVTQLEKKGIPCIEFAPTVLNFSEPMKQLDALIRDGKVKHDGDEVFSWMLSNVVAKVDNKDNVYPRKERDENKIDGVVALIMAMGAYMKDDQINLNNFIDNMISVEF